MQLHILGSHGIPAEHGGFETFAEHLSLYLVNRGWEVSVYCQTLGSGPIRLEQWQGVRRVIVPCLAGGALGTMIFDWRAIGHAIREPGICLTLGYNTALFSLRHRLAGQLHVMNMDGFEWRRGKWGRLARLWLRLNERLAPLSARVLVGDHPEVVRYLERSYPSASVWMVPYGAEIPMGIDSGQWLAKQGLDAEEPFALIVARLEPENSVLEIIRAFSRRRRRARLLVLGRLDRSNPYHQKLCANASPEVVFCGPLYDASVVFALRRDASIYFHGHTVGGTNPSLVESMAVGAFTCAHDNVFNRWVLRDGGVYFQTEDDIDAVCQDYLLEASSRSQGYREAATVRHREAFRWEDVCARYERLLSSM